MTSPTKKDSEDRARYYQPPLSRNLESLIDRLFAENETIGLMFDYNKAKFIQYCVSEKILSILHESRVWDQVKKITNELQELKKDISESD